MKLTAGPGLAAPSLLPVMAEKSSSLRLGSSGQAESEPGRKLAAGLARRDMPGKAGKLVLMPSAAAWVSSEPGKKLAAPLKLLFWTASARV